MALVDKHYKGWDIREEYTKCNKKTCKRCKEGPGHGPYLHAYKRIDTKLYHKYLGKEFPSNVDEILGITAGQVLKTPEGTFRVKRILVEIEKEGKNEVVEIYKSKAEVWND